MTRKYGKRGRCTARSKQRDERCGAVAAEGATVCRHHGAGGIRHGEANPNYRHGRYARIAEAIPQRLLDRFERAVADDDLTSVRGEIALIEARMLDVLGRLVREGSAGTWEALGGAWREFLAARADLTADQADRVGRMQAALAEIGRLIAEGAAETNDWTEVRSLVDQKARLARTEHARMRDLEQYVPVDRAVLFAQAVLNSAKARAAKDADGELTHESRVMLSAMAEDIRRLLTADTDRRELTAPRVDL